MLVDLKLSDEYDGLLYLAESKRKLPSLQSHRHRELEINLVVQGSITYVVNDTRVTLKPKALLWLFPGHEHQLISRTEDARFFVLVFTPALIQTACHDAKYDKLLRPQREAILSTTLSPKLFDLLCSLLDTLLEASLDADTLNREAGFGASSTFHFEHHDPDALNAGLRYLLLLCWRYQDQTRSAAHSVAIHRVVRRALSILSNEDNGQSLEELAKRCGASKPYLSRLFHKQVGVPLIKYRNSLRLSRFFQLYESGKHDTLTDAAYASGFGSYTQFYKIFQQAYGRGPRECLSNEQKTMPGNLALKGESVRLPNRSRTE